MGKRRRSGTALPTASAVVSQTTLRTGRGLQRATRGHERIEASGGPRTLLLFLALLGASLLLRLFALGSFPRNLMADEADNLNVIYKILYGVRPGIFGIDWKPSPAFSMYVTAPFVALFDGGVFGLRLLSALTSVLALIPLYALYRRFISTPATLLALALLSTNVWYLNFSRSGWENVHVVLLTALAFWLLTLGLESGRWLPWAACGVVATVGLYSYFAGRAILISLLVYAPLALWTHRQRWPRVLGGYALLTVVAVSFFLPQLPAIKANPEKFNLRAERVSVLNAAEEGYFGRVGKSEVLQYQLWRNARFFYDGNVLAGPSYSPPEQVLVDTRPRYSPFGRPLLEPLSALLFAGGLVMSLLARGRYVMWWVMLLIPWLVTQVLTINTPDAARGIGMLPAIYFFVALALDRLWHLLRELGKSARAGISTAQAALVVVTLAVAALTAVSYFQWAGSPQLLRAREPAVPLEQFDSWKAVQIARARASQPQLPVTVWQQQERGENSFNPYTPERSRRTQP